MSLVTALRGPPGNWSEISFVFFFIDKLIFPLDSIVWANAGSLIRALDPSEASCANFQIIGITYKSISAALNQSMELYLIYIDHPQSRLLSLKPDHPRRDWLLANIRQKGQTSRETNSGPSVVMRLSYIMPVRHTFSIKPNTIWHGMAFELPE